MNHIFRSIWNKQTGAFVAVSENTSGAGKGASGGGGDVVGAGFALKALAASLLMAFGAHAIAGPAGGVVVAGNATIGGAPGNMVIQQGSQNVALNWQSFNIAAGEAVTFVQPNSSAVALNRVLGADPSSILGNLSANGKVFLVNPNGILFGKGASVNVAGLVASTLNIGDADFMAGRYKFTGNGTGSVVNQGSISADGGYVALLGANVSNQGTISARLGTVALAAGNAITLDVAGDGMLNVTVDQGAVNALVENGGMIQADGGRVLLTAQAAGDLLHTAVNNTGIIQAQTIDTHNGDIRLLGDMQGGVVNAGGTLDASAPQGGKGGFVETSAARVKIAGGLKVTTAAATGHTGSWLIDPNDYTIAASGGDITGAELSANLVNTGITIRSDEGAGGGRGDVNVNDVVAWNANKLTLNAQNNININANLNASGSAALALEFGQGAVSAGNASQVVYKGGVINLPAGSDNFTTVQGSNGALNNYIVITSLGTQNSYNNTDLAGMNPGGMYNNFVLGADIDAAATAQWNGGLSPKSLYLGMFDGLGHALANLNIDGRGSDQSGLFAEVGSGAVVQNLRLVNVKVTANDGGNFPWAGTGGVAGVNNGLIRNVSVSGAVTARSNVGGVVGQNTGTVENSEFNGLLTATDNAGGVVGNNRGTIRDSRASGTVAGFLTLGGLVGRNNGTIQTSNASAAVTGSFELGGLVGSNNSGTITSSFASGAVTSYGSSGGGNVGGLVGWMGWGYIRNSYATGDVTASGGENVGGLVGSLYGDATLSNSYATGNVLSTSNNVGGLVGSVESSASIVSSYSTGNVAGASNVGGIAGLSGGTIDNVYASGAVVGVSNAGGLAGTLSGMVSGVYNTSASPGLAGVGVSVNGSDNSIGLSSAAMRTAANYTGFNFTTVGASTGNAWVLVDVDGTLNNLNSAVGATRPMLSSEYATTINNTHQLQLMIMDLNTAYVMGKNIDASATNRAVGDVWGSAGFVPVGNPGDAFNGNFDGRGHTISGLLVNNGARGYAGLFGLMRGNISNVGVVDAHVIGGDTSGVLAANNDQGSITNSFATGVVTGGAASGGLAGHNGGTIANSYASVAVSGNYNVGGLAGQNLGNIYASYATGAVGGNDSVGGLVGANYGTVDTSYATGAVGGLSHLGGVVGYNVGSVYHSYWNTDTFNQPSDGGGTGLSTLDMQNAASFAGFNFTSTPGATGNNWVMVDVDGSFNNAGGARGATRPMLAAEYSTLINSIHQLQLISMDLTASYTLGNKLNAAATGTGADVWSGSFVPLGNAERKFTGTFDGADFSIAALTVNRPGIDYAGLFGYVGNGALLQNVRLDGGVVSGGSDTGALAGRIEHATLVNSYASAAVIGSNLRTGGLIGSSAQSLVANSYASGSVTGNGDTGGLVGSMLGGMVSDSFAEGAVSTAGGTAAVNTGGLVGSVESGTLTNSYATGAVTGMSQVGGLAGGMFGSGIVSNSYASGAVAGSGVVVGGLIGLVTGGTVSDSYALGNVSAYSYAGGLVGWMDVYGNYAASNGLLQRVYASGTVSGPAAGGLVGWNAGEIDYGYFNATVNPLLQMAAADYGLIAGGGGLSSAQMRSVSSFTGFQFTTAAGAAGNNWVIVDTDGSLNNGNAPGATRPMLASEYATTINNAHQLQLVSMNLGAAYTLGKNIDAAVTGLTTDVWSGASFVPLGGYYDNGGYAALFAGAFNGMGHTINGLVINRADRNEVGLLGKTGTGAVVQNVGLAGGAVTGANHVGGLVGNLQSSLITNSFNTGAVSASGDSAGGVAGYAYFGVIDRAGASGTVAGQNSVGGLVGTNESGLITGSNASGATHSSVRFAGGLVGSNNAGYVSNSHASGNVSSGDDMVGGLIGYNVNGIVRETYATGNASGSWNIGGLIGASEGGFIGNSHATGSATASADKVGGLIGGLSDPSASGQLIVSNSYATGAATGSSMVGGLVGLNDSAVIANVYASGSATGDNNFVGGLVGYLNYGVVSNSYATGSVSGIGNVGGVVGYNDGQIQTSYWNTSVHGHAGVGGGTQGGTQGLNNADMRVASSFGGLSFTSTPGATGNGGNNWVMVDIDGSLNNENGSEGATRPMLASEYSTSIGNAHQLQLMSMAPAATYTLSGNIAASATGASNDVWSGSFVPIGSDNLAFTGSLDGRGYSIAGLVVNRPGVIYGGLFGYARDGASLRNLSLVGGSVSAGDYAGGLVGRLENASVSNSNASVAVSAGGMNGNGIGYTGGLVGFMVGSTLADSHATGNVDSVDTGRTGGLVGSAENSSIRNSYASGAVTSGGVNVGGLVGNIFGTTVSNSYASGSVTGAYNVGGLLGADDPGSIIANSYASGAVSGVDTVGGLVGLNFGLISRTYASGAVSAAGNAGGLVGGNLGTVVSSFWNIDTSLGASNGGIGLSTAAMQSGANFNAATAANGFVNPAWDLGSTWIIYDGHSAPLLRSFMTALTVTANNVGKTYDAQGFNGNNGVSYSTTPNGNLLGSISPNYGGDAQGAVNAGVYGITASGLYSGQDGYAISYAAGALTINKAVLTASVSVADRSYDGSTDAAAALTITGGLVGGETLASVASASFNSKDVVGASVVTVDSVTLLDGANGGLARNYVLAAGQTTAAAITARALTATATASDKTYDGDNTAAAVLTITDGLVAGERIGASAVATFNSKNVLDANLVTVNSTVLADGANGGLASNYSLASNQTAAAAITSRALTASASAADKTYDGNTTAAATLVITDGLVIGETVSATGIATFNSKDVLAANLVTVNSATLVNGTNGLASNYSLVTGQSANAAIAAKALTASASAAGKTYDGNTTAAATLAITDGLVTGETVSATGSATFNSKDVLAANLVTVNSATVVNGTNGLASNYSLVTGQSANAAIAAKELTASVGASGKTYDGNTNAATTLAIISGLVDGETVSATGAATFNSKDVLDANLVTVNSATLVNGANGLASNYSLATGQSASAAISAKALTASLTTAGKTYDGNANAAAMLAIISGLVDGETVSATGAATFNSKDVLDANLVTVNSANLVNGANGLASNYSLTTGQSASAAISAKALTASMTTAGKTYDGNANAAATLAITGGLVDGETVSATGTATFNSKDVLDANLVTVNGATLVNGANGLASNYSLVTGQSASAAISAKALTASLTTAGKTYDGNANAAAALAITSGLIDGETVSANGTASFNSKDVLDANLVTVNSATLVNGTNGLASNYSLTTGQSASAAISAKALTASMTTAGKTYDGNANAAATLAITGGLVDGETVSATGTASFNSKDVLDANLVRVNSATLVNGNNGLASNYILLTGQSASAAIAAKALMASFTTAGKTYDGNANAAATLAITSGLVDGETVSASGTATFNSKDVLDANLVTVNSATLVNGANGLASNYSLTTGQSASAAISAKALTASMTTAGKTYDGNANAAATLAITGGLVDGETVSATGTATFNSKDVLDANLVTVNGATLVNGANGLASNYSLTTGQSASAAISAKALTAAMTTAGKTYDGNANAAATLAITGGLVDGETVSATGTATFNSKDVLDANLVTVHGATLVNGANGLASNYSLTTGQSASAAISAKALTASMTTAGKTYDGNANAAATLAITGGLVDGETVSATGAATFNSKDVLDANLVTVNSATLVNGTNGLASNYSLATGQSASAAISAKALTASLTTAGKTYDGNANAAATLAITGGLVDGETVSATGTATFNSKDVLDANLVTVNGATLVNGANGLASNYSLTTGQSASAAISAKALTASLTTAGKTYDGNANATATLTVTSGLVDGETVSASGTATFNSKDVLDANLVTVNGATLVNGANGLASNYSLTTGQSASAAISAKALTAAMTTAGKTYDGNANAAATLAITGGLVDGETVSATGTATFNSKDVLDANLVTVHGATLVNGANGLASNYSLTTGQSASAAISAKALTASLTTAGKTYDGNANATATLTVTSGLVDGETVSVSGTATFNSKDVLDARLVTVNSATLADGINGLASNYSLVGGQTAAATIAAKALTASASAANKTYDGNAVAAASLAINGGLVGTETVTASGAATFNSKDVLNANLVTVNSATLADGSNGGLASNYMLAGGQTAAATIAAKVLTASASAANKTYDGNAVAAASLAINGGLVGTETVTASGAATFNSKDVLNANLVTINSATLADGSNGGLASNYMLAGGQTAAAIIAAKVLTASASAANKTYDGNAVAAASLAINGGLVGTETVTASGAATFNSKDVLNANLVTFNSATLADGSNGGLASNYVLSSGQTAAATIAAKVLTATASAANKNYDGNTVAAANLAINGGLVGAETVTASGAATFNSKDVLNANLVTLNSATLADGSNGGLASNYFLTSGQTAAATIAAKVLTASASAANKTYDGNAVAAASLAINGGLVGAETVTASGAATFNSKDVLNANLVTFNSATLADGSNGGLASNYFLTSGQKAAATIAAKALTASASAANKTYDGSNSAAALLAITAGLVGSETVTASGAATFNSKDVASANQVTVNSTLLANGGNGGLASNYSLAAGQTAAATISPKTVTVSGLSASSKVYDGNTVAALAGGVLNGVIGAETLVLTGQTGAFADKNVGSAKLVLVSGATLANGSGLASNYRLTAPAAVSADISRLAAVTWVGGASGSWFVASNWAGGAVPDLANVANVLIPAGVTVTFGGGAVSVDTIGASGSLAIEGGSLAVSNTVSLTSLAQSGGALSAGAVKVDNFSQSGGTLASTGDVTVTTSYRQSGGSVAAGGKVTITQASGAASLGNISAAGPLTVNAINGDITQLAGSHIAAPSGGVAAPAGTVTLASSGNSIGAVVVTDAASAMPAVGPVNPALLQNALAGAVAMGGTEVAPVLAVASSGSARTGRIEAGGRASGMLAGLNLTLVGQGVSLPDGVETASESADER